MEIVTELWRHPRDGLAPGIITEEGSVQVHLSVNDRGVHMFLFALLAALGRGAFV